VPLALALQDARLEHLEAGGSLDFLDAWLERHPDRRDADPARELWSWHLSRSRTDGGSLDRLLTARLEPDRAGALYQLRLLSEEYPDDPWPWLGVAHAELRLGHVGEARAALERALELDPSNPRAHRIECLLFARSGEERAAVLALERWLERTSDDPLTSPAERVAVELELAAALLDAERFQAARVRLDLFLDPARALGLDLGARYRAHLLRAAALEGLGQWGAALTEATAAADLEPARLMPQVQRALLLQYRLGDAGGALEAWARVEQLAESAPEGDLLGAYLFAQRARVERARLEGRLSGAEG
jgi:Tfp pilus assembly protein PilF